MTFKKKTTIPYLSLGSKDNVSKNTFIFNEVDNYGEPFSDTVWKTCRLAEQNTSPFDKKVELKVQHTLFGMTALTHWCVVPDMAWISGEKRYFCSWLTRDLSGLRVNYSYVSAVHL